MHLIQMVDLGGQYLKIKGEIDQAITNVLKNTAFINGPQVNEFENNLSYYNNSKFCISCGSGTDALKIAMMALDLKSGDEVIMPAFTFVAIAETAALLKLKPAFIDVDPATFNIDPDKIRNAISPKTKVIAVAHMFGQSASMKEIITIAREKNLIIIEDAAQAIGAKYILNNLPVSCGNLGDIGTTSFFPSKNLGCFGDGGAIFTNNQDLASKAKKICNHGQERKYFHDVIGLNSRLDTLQAAILNVKLKYLDSYIQKRQETAKFYDSILGNHTDIVIPGRNVASTHVFNQYTIQIPDGKRERMKQYLAEKGIPSMIYYPMPLHLQKAYQYLGYKKGDFPVSEKLSENVLSLPIHTELDIKQLSYISENVLNFYK
jgi:UDP-2-acetamido-2-deoxy-ribo-hexuluronate aminotransferase